MTSPGGMVLDLRQRMNAAVMWYHRPTTDCDIPVTGGDGVVFNPGLVTSEAEGRASFR